MGPTPSYWGTGSTSAHSLRSQYMSGRPLGVFVPLICDIGVSVIRLERRLWVCGSAGERKEGKSKKGAGTERESGR